MGQYEFPGPDVPVAVDGRMVMKRFELSPRTRLRGGMAGGY
jgi:hypothetical protein